MRDRILLLTSFCLLAIFTAALAWTNPPGNPPSGGGAIQTDSSGNVSIGGAPTTGVKLHVIGGDFRIDNGRQLIFRGSGANGGFLVDASNNLQWRDPNNNTAIFYLNSGGYVGLGAAPTEKLDVSNGEIRFGYTGGLGGVENSGLNSQFYHNVTFGADYQRRDALKPASVLAIGDLGLYFDYKPAGAGSLGTALPWTGTPLFRILPNGNVGINTDLPSDRFVIVGGAGSVIFPATGEEIRFAKNGVNYISAPGAAAALAFQVGGVDRLTILTSAIDAKSNKIINLAPPTAGTDAVTKDYVDRYGGVGGAASRLWGEGRPGSTVRAVAGECVSSLNPSIKVSRSEREAHWDNAAAACPVGWWVCTEAERGTNSCNDAGIGQIEYLNCNPNDGVSGNGQVITGDTAKAWVANAAPSTSSRWKGRSVNNSASPGVTNEPLCSVMPVWCCSY